MKTLNDVSLTDITPETLAQDAQVSASIEAIDPQLRAIAENVDLPSLYVNINSLSSLALDHLAIQYDVTVWRDTWPVALKRSVLMTAISDKRKKGTLGAVKQALESLGSASTVVEWWQEDPPATPHTFKIFATQSNVEGVITSELQEDVIAMIDDAKPLRSHYTFSVQQNEEGRIGVFGVLRVQTVSSVRSVEADMVDAEGAIAMFGAARTIIKRHLIASA